MMLIGPGAGPIEMKPYLVLLLKPGWLYDSDRRRFTGAAEGSFSPQKGDLPPRTRIVPMVPDLVGRPQESLSEDEAVLARYYHVIFPSDTDVARFLQGIQGWLCVEEVRAPPEISLP
jgi:hypothetical protein